MPAVFPRMTSFFCVGSLGQVRLDFASDLVFVEAVDEVVAGADGDGHHG